MILKRCDKGHYYDGEIYQECPECSGKAQNAQAFGMEDTDYGDEDSVTVALPRSHGQSSAKNQARLDASEEENVTVALPHSHGQHKPRKRTFKPVVGWLVCIQGKDFGSSFTLQLGKNYIGRSVHMDVMLQGDESIAMEKHAAVYYVPKYRRFAAEPGTAGKRVFVNKEQILRPVWIKQHDRITLGNTSLMFFPCCGEHFSWEELLRKYMDSRRQ